MSTIHAFCGDLLRRYGPLVGLRPDFRLVGATDGYFLLRRLADDLVLSRYQPLGAPALHFPTLLAAIYEATCRVLDAPDFYIALYNPTTELLDLASEVVDGQQRSDLSALLPVMA